MLIQNPTNKQFLETDRLSVLNDYIHVIDEHILDEINYTVAGCDCNQYKDAKELKKKGKDGIIKLMMEIHVYLYHNVQRKASKPRYILDAEHKIEHKIDDEEVDEKYDDDEKKEKKKKSDNWFSFGFGSFIYYNLLKPNQKKKFKCFKEEFLHYEEDEEFKLGPDDWTAIYDEAEMRLKTDKAKGMKIKYDDNNVLKMQPIQIGDILAVKCYTDLQELQCVFRRSFRNLSWDDTQNTTKKIITKHANKYYFWGKWLNHAISVYGNKINNENVIYYHGLNNLFMFSSFRKDFDMPTSVTTSLSVAKHFASNTWKGPTDKGIVLQLQCQWSYTSKWNLSKALSVKWISYKPSEEEVLLFGNFNQLIISDIMHTIDYKNNHKHKQIIETINIFESLCDGRKINIIYNDERHDIMKQLMDNEQTNKLNSYFAKIFHNICQKRTQFAIKTFIMYQNDRSDVFMKLRRMLKEKQTDFHCNKCVLPKYDTPKMIKIDDKKDDDECIECGATSKQKCGAKKEECKYVLCSSCSDIWRGKLGVKEKDDFHCNQCRKINYVKMKKIDNTSSERLKCIDCKATAIWKCEQYGSECKYVLCSKCGDMIKQLQYILVNAKHVISVPELNAVKMNALRVQTIQIMESHRSWRISDNQK